MIGWMRAAVAVSSRRKTFDRIYHINPGLLVEAISDVPSLAALVRKLVYYDRLRSLEDLLNDLKR